MRRASSCALFLTLLSCVSLAGEGSVPDFPLALPLQTELPVTGSFGEYRAGHFHAGLDFSTRGELGWPVRAAADGEIYRVKVQARGYGRALYIRHARGFETVYGHLHVFENGKLGLERFVARQRERLQDRFPGDLYLDPPITVKQGQIIALSGEKGGGLPHLHLELRYQGAPVDPMRYAGIHPAGLAAPVLQELLFLPRGPCKVNGKRAPVTLKFQLERGVARLTAVPQVEGRCGLLIKAQVPGAGKMSLSKLAVDCGEGRFLRMDLNRFSFEQYHQVGLLYDVERSTSTGAFFYRLQLGVGLDLPDVSGAGLDPLPGGTLHCRIRAESADGQEVRGEFVLQVDPKSWYSSGLPDAVSSFELYPRLLLLNGELPLDPQRLPTGAASVPGMPILLLPGQRRVLPPLRGIEIHLPDDAFYAPTLLAWIAVPEARLPLPGLRVMAGAVRLAPDGLFLRHGASLTAQPSDLQRAAFYRLRDDGDGWVVLGGEVDDGRLTVDVRVGGTYAVFQDESPPRITGVHLRTEKRLDRRRLVFPVEEVGEGIDWAGCRVLLDGTPVETLYDPDRRWSETWLVKGLRGKHSVDAVCVDGAGNSSLPFRATVSL